MKTLWLALIRTRILMWMIIIIFVIVSHLGSGTVWLIHELDVVALTQAGFIGQ